MPVVNGRLTCCTCGADLGDAEDPYRDPTCMVCEERSAREEDKGLDDGQCDRCDGTGHSQTEDGQLCDKCGGSGRLDDDDDDEEDE